jgi:hypothetical protein
LVFCITLLFNVSTASAATLADDMVQASKDACINLAKKRGFSVENVIDAQPADGDSAHVVLKLAKGGERFEFNCGFSQNIRQFVEAAPVVKTTQATTIPANQPTNRVVESKRDRTAKDRTPVAQRDRQRQRDQVVVAEPKRGSGFNPAWLLPLLLLPLAFLFLRNRDGESGEPTKVGSYSTPATAAAVKVATPVATTTTVNNVVEAMLRIQDSAIEVRSGAGLTDSVTRSIASGSKVRLSGRYQNDWAELAEGGWIAIQSMAKDPRLS